MKYFRKETLAVDLLEKKDWREGRGFLPKATLRFQVQFQIFVSSKRFLAEVFHPWVRWEGPASGFENSSGGAGAGGGGVWAQVGGPKLGPRGWAQAGPKWVGPSWAQVGGPPWD